MKVEFVSDFPVTDVACRKATGRSLQDWYKEIDGRVELKSKRRDAIQWIVEATGVKDPWWPTTIWVEYERVNGVVNKKDSLAEGFNICVTKTVAAAVPEMFRAWSDSKSLNRWFGESVKATVTDGGKFDDGDGHSGDFLRVRADKDLRFTWVDPGAASATLVDVVFQDKGKGKSGLMLQHQRIQNRSEADGLRRAWGAALDACKAMLEA
jgi:uncharacterized protein YndB with AHSA1/START domain